MPNSIPHPDQPIDPHACPVWCSGGDVDHDTSAIYRRHTGDLVAIPARVEGGSDSLTALTITRHDGPDGPGEPVITLADGVEIDFVPESARALGMALLDFADRLERAPREAARPRRHRGRLVLARGVHDLVCSWQVATRDEEFPGLLHCAGCSTIVEITAPDVTR